MDNTLRNVQDGGLFGLFKSDTEKKIKDLNHKLKIVIASQKKGDGFRIKKTLKQIIYEEETALNDLINSDFSIKKDFYRILKQWADLYTNGKVEDKADKQPGVFTKVFGFEKFLKDLDFVYGSPEEKISIGDGARTMYDDVEFYNILFPKIKEYMQQKVKHMPSIKKAFLAGNDMMATLTILSSHFKVMDGKNDLNKLKQVEFCNFILTTLNHIMREDGQMYIQLLNYTYDTYPAFKDICPINKLIDGTLAWLEKDAATGKEEQRHRFKADQYNLILRKLETFYKLESILNLENNNKFKQILFGSKKEKGKIIKWMMYIRQYKKQMKQSDKKQNIKIQAKDGKMIPINYDRTFLDVFNELMDKTYPTFFRTSYANVEKGNRPGFFSNLKNMFSTSKGPDKYFDIIKNDLYDELIKWLGVLQKTGDYIRLLTKISDLFPDIIDSNKFLTYAKLNEKIISVVTKPGTDFKTGKPFFDQKFTYVKKDLESLGKLLQMHIKPGNHIDKLYNSKEFNNIFYTKLKILVGESKTEASKHGFTLVESNSENQNFDELQNNFNSNLFEKIQPKIGININTIEELSDLLDDYYDIVNIAQLLPKKFSGQHPMANTEIIEKTKAIPISKKTFSNEKSKETFYKILIDMKNLLQADSGKPLTILHYMDAIIDPDHALSWHLSSDFYTKDQKDGSVKSIDGTNQSSYGNLEQSERRTSSDLIANAQSDEVSQILQDNLPEVSKLSGEIANLLKIIDDQGKKLQETDYIIDTLINDENSILEEVSEKVKSVDDLISSNDLDTLIKRKRGRPSKVKKVITVEIEKTGGSKRKQRKMLIGTYKTGKNQIKNLYRSGNLDVFFYINNNKKRKRVDFDSTRISL
jgi:hypothetical protein